MEFDTVIREINFNMSTIGLKEDAKKRVYMSKVMAVKSVAKQKELNDFIEKLQKEEYDCFTTDRNGVVEILKQFLVQD